MSVEGPFNCLSRYVESSVPGINRQFVLGGIGEDSGGIQSSLRNKCTYLSIGEVSVQIRVQATYSFRGVDGPEPASLIWGALPPLVYTVHHQPLVILF